MACGSPDSCDSLVGSRVPNTLMQNGKPVNPPSNKPATSIPNANFLGAQDNYSPGFLQLINDLQFCTGVSAVTTDGGTSYGTYDFPC
jgi:hypothetical protein